MLEWDQASKQAQTPSFVHDAVGALANAQCLPHHTAGARDLLAWIGMSGKRGGGADTQLRLSKESRAGPRNDAEYAKLHSSVDTHSTRK